jgi:Leucine-rich repeat (LRR) protein
MGISTSVRFVHLTFSMNYLRAFLVCIALVLPCTAFAQPYYFFNGFPDASQPGAWYNNPQGLGIGETGFIAGQQYIVETGRTAVINSVWAMPDINLVIRPGALLVIANDINGAGAANIAVDAGGIVRVHNNPSISGLSMSYTANSTLYYTGSTNRMNTNIELPNGTVNVNIVHDNTGGIAFTGYTATINGNVSVSSGTLVVGNFSTFTFAGTTTIAKGALTIDGNSTLTSTGDFILGNGTECYLKGAGVPPTLELQGNITFGGGNIRTDGSGRLAITGNGTAIGRMNFVQTGITPPVIQELVCNRPNVALGLGTNLEIKGGGTFDISGASSSFSTNNFQLFLRGGIHNINNTLNINSQGLVEVNTTQLAGTGNINVASNARLRMFDASNGPTVAYVDATSILEYFGTNILTPLAMNPNTELPSPMQGSLVITKTNMNAANMNVVELNNSLVLNGNLTIAPATPPSPVNSPVFELRNAVDLTLNGRITTQGNTPTIGVQGTSGQNNLTIAGNDTNTIRNFSVAQNLVTPNLNPYLLSFTIDRPARLELSRDLVIDALAGSLLRLRRGIIVPPQTATGRVIMLNPSSTSIEGGSPTSYIQGPLQRAIGSTIVSYPYPVGTSTEYMPMSIVSPPAATPSPGVVITPQSNAPGGFVQPPVATFKDNRRQWVLQLSTITPIGPFNVQLSDTNLVASNVVVTAPNSGANYSSLGGILTGTSLVRSSSPVSGISDMSQQIFLRIGNTTPPPTITRFVPRVVASGATISVEGTNFVNVTRVAASTTTMSNFTVFSESQLIATLPSTIATANPNDNVVRIPLIVHAQGGTTASVDTLVYVLLPNIQSFSPSIGGRGTAVNITGFRFSGTYATTPTVTFGGIPAQSVTVLSSNVIRAIVPQNATTGVIRVSTPGGTVASVSIFTFIPPPRISAFFPTIAKEGDLVTIEGSGFTDVINVSFGGIAARSYTVNSPNRITAQVAGGSTGTVSILTVGGFITSATVFLFAPPPTITNVSPRISGTSGTIELRGTGFVGVREVRFTSASINITSATMETVSSTLLRVSAPAVSVYEEVNVNLLTAGGATSTTQTVTLVRSPQILGFTPLSGTTGTLVQIFGANFLASTISNVRIAGVTAASVTVVSDSLIVARVGRINTSGTVSITAPGGTSVASTTFANIAPPPQITSITPQFAIVGSVVTILGENFNDANVLRITNPTTRVSVTAFVVVTNGQATFVVPPNATSGTVEIRTSGGTGFSPLPLTFLPPPTVHVLEPPFGVIGSTVVLQGENLRGVQEIRIGEARATNITPNSPTQLTFTLGPNTVLGFNQPFTITSTQGTTVLSEIFSVVTQQQLDSLALVSIYNRTNGANWARKLNWLTLRPISQWQGVTVDSASRRVVRLSLAQNNMVGAFPLALQFLTTLKTLDWQDNRLTGRIQPFIATLRNLDTLRLGQNLFSPSALPDSLGNLRSLQVLNLSGDSLTGAIPRSLASATNLTEFDLSNNQLADSVPNFLSNLTNLRTLRLNNNRLIGTIPSGFGTTTLVAKMFERSVNAAPNLEELNLSDNQLTGTIPTSLSSLTNLRTLSLANNRLEGTLTGAFVQRFTTIATLNLGGNRLSGTIPAELGSLKQLRFLSLRRNQFIGTVPDALNGATNLETLWLDNNQLAGGIGRPFEDLARLARVDVSNNRLTSLPRLARIRPLNYVNAANNRLDFGSLEEVAQIDTILITPQDSIAAPRTVRGIESLPVRLSVVTGGTSNRYQWFRETPSGAVAVSPILRDSIFQFIFTQASSGTYTCRVTNVLPEMRTLTLISRPITLEFGGLPPAPTQVPQPISPFDGATYVPTNATLTWSFTSDASTYDVQVSQSPTFMPLLSEQSAGDTVLRLRALPYEQPIYWRVRGRNIAGITPFSAASTFTTSPRNIDILATSVRFPRTPIGDTTRSVLILTNTSTATLVVQSLTIDDGENSFRLPDDVRGLTLRPNAEQRLDIEFSPRTVGTKLGTVRIQYSAQGVGAMLLTQTFANLVQGRGTPLKIIDVDMDTVRVDRATLTTIVIQNKLPRNAQNIATIRGVRTIFNSRDNAFSIETFSPPLSLYPGDVTAIIVRCAPSLVGRLQAQFEIQADIDTLRANVRAIAAQTPRDSLFLEFGIRPTRDSVAPGGRVDVELFIKEDRNNLASELARRRRVFQNLGPRFIEGSLRYNPNVLSLVPNLYFEEITNATQRNDFQRVALYVPRTLWNSPDSLVVARVPFRVVSGNTNITPLILEDIGLGPDRRSLGQRKIFIDQPLTPTTATRSQFIAGVCEAGGLRLTTTARAVSLTAVSPNPVKDAAEISYAVREDGLVVLDLIDMQGKVMQTLVSADHAPGEYLLGMETRNLPSGTYFLRLITPTTIKTQKLHVVK